MIKYTENLRVVFVVVWSIKTIEIEIVREVELAVIMDLYNEPLNLSVRSKPVAVVPPSSSNKNYDCESNARTGTPNNNFEMSQEDDESTSDTQNTTENIKTVMHQQYNSSNNNNNNNSNNNLSNDDNASVRNVSEPNLLNLASHANGTSATMLSIKKKNLVDNNNSDDDDEDEDNDSVSRNASPASVPYQKSAISAILTAYMENFHEHQQSLDAAKLHLQQYLKLTNQYLQKYTELVPNDLSMAAAAAAASSTQNNGGNDTINNIIHTNILTNKITTNNLISIINKLLEQNIVSEFYFKHATAFQEQQKLRQDICHDELDYDGPASGMSALMGNGTSNIINSSGAAMVATTGGMLGGMILDQLSLGTNNNNNNNGASNNTRNDRHSVMLSDNNNSSSLMTTNAVLGGISGLTAPLFMNQSHANKLKTMKNLAMIARERCIFL